MTEPNKFVSVNYVKSLNMPFDWRDLSVTQRLRVPISTMTNVQRIKFGEAHVP
jgi:hypothetical protein